MTFMSVPSISSTASTTNAASTDAAQLPQQTLNQNEFLQLLVAQLSQQDPMNPVSDWSLGHDPAVACARRGPSQRRDGRVTPSHPEL
ncbi:exported hypothetical protein [Verrucomicrobia bacterium]|nr:exported hypothetical protein [Verrucomicrobiota bacterium]